MNALAQIIGEDSCSALFYRDGGFACLVVIFTVVRDLRQVLSKKDELGGTDL